MTREEAMAQIRACLRHMTPDDGPPDEDTREFVMERPANYFPSVTRFVLCEMLGLACKWWPRDKVRWQVSARYRGHLVVFEDRKLGFLVAYPPAMSGECVDELHARLAGAERVLAVHLKATAKTRLEDGEFTVENRYHHHERAYRYFRERARVAYASPPPEPVVHVLDVDANGKPKETVTTWDQLHPAREGALNAVAMMNEFFSRLEHTLILLLPAVDGFVPGAGRVRDLITSGWKEKFKAVFALAVDLDAKRLFDRLFELKEALRNPHAHGSFMKDGESAWFHYSGIGALPMGIHDHEFDRLFVDQPSFEDVCAVFDDCDRFFASHARIGLAMSWVDAGLDAKFDPASLAKYRAALNAALRAGDRSRFDKFVEWEAMDVDAYVNYEG